MHSDATCSLVASPCSLQNPDATTGKGAPPTGTLATRQWRGVPSRTPREPATQQGHDEHENKPAHKRVTKETRGRQEAHARRVVPSVIQEMQNDAARALPSPARAKDRRQPQCRQDGAASQVGCVKWRKAQPLCDTKSVPGGESTAIQQGRGRCPHRKARAGTSTAASLTKAQGWSPQCPALGRMAAAGTPGTAATGPVSSQAR